MVQKPKRSRSERRARERELRRSVRELERLSAAAPGGAPDRPLVVSSASVVEVQARGTPCVQCGGTLDLRDHAAESHGGQLLRVARLQCRLCHARRALWFRIDAPLPS